MASSTASSSSLPTASSTLSSSSAQTVEEKIKIGLSHKSSGNAAFVKGDYKAALGSYHLAVLYLSGLEQRSILGLVGENSGTEGKPEDLSSDSEDEEVAKDSSSKDAGAVAAGRDQKELSLVYSNMSACYLKQTNYPRAIGAAEKALKCNSRNLKASYRKAQAMRLGGDIYNARTYLQQVIESASRLEKKNQGELESFRAELKAVEKVIEAKEAMGRNKWKGFLGKKPNVFSVDQQEQDKGDTQANEAASTARHEDNDGEAAQASQQ